ncbi:MAG: hypothetical protein Q4C99_08195 [Clostridia bacterium]|nr:hypothetical protein [Clostridia bacterium]
MEEKTKKNTDAKKIIIIVLVTVLVVAGFAASVYFYISNTQNSIKKMQESLQTTWNEAYDNSEEIPEFFKAFNEKSNFEVTNVKDDGSGHYTVTASVTSPDIKDALIDYQKNFDVNQTKDDIDKKITEIINNAEMKTTEQTATVIITDEQTEITFGEDFIDAMYGYAYNYAKAETDKALSLE